MNALPSTLRLSKLSALGHRASSKCIYQPSAPGCRLCFAFSSHDERTAHALWIFDAGAVFTCCCRDVVFWRWYAKLFAGVRSLFNVRVDLFIFACLSSIGIVGAPG